MGCENALDLDEYVFLCEDGIDNDNDGWTDIDDPDCANGGTMSWLWNDAM